jgi:hypothetical protein
MIKHVCEQAVFVDTLSLVEWIPPNYGLLLTVKIADVIFTASKVGPSKSISHRLGFGKP